MTQGVPSNAPLALLSGIPGTGKSTFGQWCASNRGFVHIDAEHGGFDAVGIGSEWQMAARIPAGDVEPLVAAFRRLDRPVVLDWGYPPAFLPLVRALHSAGITAWWFDGDRAAARRRFGERGTVSVGALNHQLESIDAAWPELSVFYGVRVVVAIKPDGSFASPEEIFHQVFETAPE